jgi:hypothetical protein
MIQFESIDRADAREFAAPELVTDELEKRDDRLRLQMAPDQVPVQYRRPLIAHFVDGLSIREIARRQRVPFGTVLSRIFKGKQLLRQAWDAPLPASRARETTRGSSPHQPRGPSYRGIGAGTRALLAGAMGKPITSPETTISTRRFS